MHNKWIHVDDWDYDDFPHIVDTRDTEAAERVITRLAGKLSTRFADHRERSA